MQPSSLRTVCTRPVQFSIVHLGGLGRQQGAKFGLSTFLITCFAHGMHIHAVSDMSSSKFFGSWLSLVVFLLYCYRMSGPGIKCFTEATSTAGALVALLHRKTTLVTAKELQTILNERVYTQMYVLTTPTTITVWNWMPLNQLQKSTYSPSDIRHTRIS